MGFSALELHFQSEFEGIHTNPGLHYSYPEHSDLLVTSL
jgi:hypothetical protein